MGKMRAVMMPRPPALETAEANSAVPTCIMPPWTTGTVGTIKLVNAIRRDRESEIQRKHTADAKTACQFCGEGHFGNGVNMLV